MLARISALKNEIADVEHAEYLLGKERETAFDQARKTILPLFANTRDGMLDLTPAYLRSPDATYLMIDLSNGGFAPSNGRYILTRIGFKMAGKVQRAVNLDTGADLGFVNDLSVTAQGQWKPHVYYSHDPIAKQHMVQAWSGLRNGSPEEGMTHHLFHFMLPLSGPALRHPAFQRMAAFAHAALAGTIPELAALAAYNRKMDALQDQREAKHAEVLAIVHEAAKVNPPEKHDLDLVLLMDGMHWSWEQEDTARETWRQREREISRRLNALPIEVAVAFLKCAGEGGRLWHYPHWFIRMRCPQFRIAA